MTTRLRLLPAFAAVVAAGILTVAAPASADVGDGLLTCNSGEICLKKHADARAQYLRHFYWDDMGYTAGGGHGNENFTDNGGRVADNVSGVWNRDTECGVYLEDIRADGYWFDYYVMTRRSSGGYEYITSSTLNDKNNGHRRCSPYRGY